MFFELICRLDGDYYFGHKWKQKNKKNPQRSTIVCGIVGLQQQNCEIHSFVLESFFLEFGENYNSLASELY